MKFICNICGNTTDIYKVKFTATKDGLVCKDAICCNKYMVQLITKEYEGIPEIKRNEEHCKSSNYVKGLMKGEQNTRTKQILF